MFILGGGIPDAAVIHAARKKREAARAAGGGNTAESRDYIPIKKKEEGRVKRGPRLVKQKIIAQYNRIKVLNLVLIKG